MPGLVWRDCWSWGLKVGVSVGIGLESMLELVNPFPTGDPLLGTKLLGFSIGRGLGALKGFVLIPGSVWVHVGAG